MSKVAKFINAKKAIGIEEYGIIFLLIVALVILIVAFIGTDMKSKLVNIADKLTKVSF